VTNIDPENVHLTEVVNGETVHLMYIEVWDGLYTPIGVRLPEGDGPFPIVLLAAGNGGEGMRWVRDAVRNRAYIQDRLAEAGMASAWLRYRTEVELGYNNGGTLVRDKRQGREMFNRSPSGIRGRDRGHRASQDTALGRWRPDRPDRDEPWRRDDTEDRVGISRRRSGRRQ
jgi:hypothetical protein